MKRTSNGSPWPGSSGRWQSLTGKPRATEAQTRGVETRNQPKPEKPEVSDTEAIATRAREAERDRVSCIYDLAGRLNLERGIAEDLVKRGVCVDESRRVVLDQVAAKPDETWTFPHISIPLDNVIAAEAPYSNGLDRIETIRSDGRIEGADPGKAAVTGRVEVRSADSTLITQATNNTPCESVFAWSLCANASFTFTAHDVYLPRPRLEIPGSQGFQATLDWHAAKATSPARMCTSSLVNTVVSY